jgi:hypothetical protein
VRHGRGEVDRPEHEHPRPRCVRRDEHPHALPAALTVGPVRQRLGAPRREQPPHVVGDGRVGPLAAQRPGDDRGCRATGIRTSLTSAPLARHLACGTLGAHDEAAAHEGRIRVVDDGRDRHRAAGLDVGGDGAQLGKGLLRHGLHEHVEDAAARQPDRERVVVADPVALEDRGPRGHDLKAELVDGALDAPAGDRPHGLATGADEHRRTRRAGRGAEGRDDGADAHGIPGVPPRHQLVQHVTHAPPPPSVPGTPPSSAPRRSRRHGAGPP